MLRATVVGSRRSASYTARARGPPGGAAQGAPGARLRELGVCNCATGFSRLGGEAQARLPSHWLTPRLPFVAWASCYFNSTALPPLPSRLGCLLACLPLAPASLLSLPLLSGSASQLSASAFISVPTSLSCLSSHGPALPAGSRRLRPLVGSGLLLSGLACSALPWSAAGSPHCHAHKTLILRFTHTAPLCSSTRPGPTTFTCETWPGSSLLQLCGESPWSHTLLARPWVGPHLTAGRTSIKRRGFPSWKGRMQTLWFSVRLQEARPFPELRCTKQPPTGLCSGCQP